MYYNSLQKQQLIKGFKVYGATTGDQSGYAVYGSCDFNNDGIKDLIISAPSESALFRSLSGVIYILFGRKLPFSDINLAKWDSSYGIRIIGTQEDYIGQSLGSGDINGDGIDDLITGSWTRGSQAGGQAYVIFGRKGITSDIDLKKLDNTQGFKITSDDYRQGIGYSVSSGDINKDGFDDVIISGKHETLVNNCNNYVLYGKPKGFFDINVSNITTDIGFKITNLNTAPGYYCGNIVVKSADLNKDGYDDIILGANEDSPLIDISGRIGAGITYIINGREKPFADIELNKWDNTLGSRIFGEANGDNSGYSISVGDVNKDGYIDITIGAPHTTNIHGSDQVGKTYVVYGKYIIPSNDTDLKYLNNTYGFKISNINGQLWSGYTTSVGDLNGDGYLENIIGTMRNTVYVVSGKANNFKDIDLTNLTNQTGYAIPLAGNVDASSLSTGDVNMDGYDDNIIGVLSESGINGLNSGVTYVFYGNSFAEANIGYNTGDLAAYL